MQTVSIKTKVCYRCRDEKSLDFFYKNKKSKDGYGGMCKVCYKEYQAHRRKTDLAFRENKQKYANEWYHRSEENKERAKQNRIEWGKRNPEKVIKNAVDQRRKRRARIVGAAVIETIDLDTLYARDAGFCKICEKPCTREEASVDHIKPLSKGGNHSWKNVQLAHRVCNSRKGAREDFFDE